MTSSGRGRPSVASDVVAAPDLLELFEGAPCGLVVTDEDGRILRANRTFCDWLGYTDAELSGMPFQNLLTVGGRIFHQTHWAPLMRLQGSVAEVKLSIVHRDRRQIIMLLNGVRREHEGKVYNELAFFGTADRDKYERELLKARKAAEDLLQEKIAAEAALRLAQAELSEAYETAHRRATFAEQMVAIVSHDLKNPLTGIKMATDLLARGQRTVQESRLLQHVGDSVQRATRMIADLLDLTVIRVGRGISVNPIEIDLHTFIGHCVDELRVAFPSAELAHRSNGSGLVALDNDRLFQVIGNLTANSVAYGDNARPVTITSALDAGTVSISVHNFGPVIPEAQRTRLFEPLTRGADVHADLRSVGLGLFIVREIARAHGGDVSVVSDADEGTTFTVRLPRRAGEASLPG
jgi:sigma-B regulation protein RsbU (phosphoserine phosphatase)